MKLPNIWGQGALFAFSGLDGECLFSKDFAGYLCEDKLGIRFPLSTARELYFDMSNTCDLSYEAVTSDWIKLRTTAKKDNAEHYIVIVFAEQRLIVGHTHIKAIPNMLSEGNITEKSIDGVKLHISDKDTTAIAVKQDGDNATFAFAYGQTEKEAFISAQRGLSYDISLIENKRKQFYENIPEIDAPESVERVYKKCFSVMKSQFYTAEEKFTGLWTTPDRLPHRHMWLWDSVFHSIGNKHISAAVGEDTIRALFSIQRPDGFIPHRGNSVNKSSEITQPPIIAWGVNRMYEYNKNTEFVKEAYPSLKKYLLWNKANRSTDGGDLYAWHIETDSYHCRCDESGMDNSPRFDTDANMEAIDFSCFMANELRYMAKLAKILDLSEDVIFWENWFEKIKTAINKKLWDNDRKCYFDRNVSTGSFNEVWSPAAFLPLFAGICSSERAEILFSYLNDKNMFSLPLPLPSVSKSDKVFGSDMWRGSVWINYNYMIAEGLTEYGYRELAEEIIQKTINSMTFWYEQDGVIYEFYDSLDKVSPSRLNRKGPVIRPYNLGIKYQSIRDYGWSCTLLADMIYNKYKA